MNEEYRAVRARFVELCCFDLPARLLEERKTNAPSEFDHFCADPRLDCVAVEVPNLWFGTKRLAMEAPDSKFYWVGRFAVHINVQNKAIACVGEEKKESGGFGVWHPHVRAVNNQACFGGAGMAKLTNWFGDGQCGHLALYVLEFLCLARGSDYYIAPNAWKELTAEEIIEWKKLRS